ncbi:hypothetical protein EX30DRAFT_60856 [Ascodesmis nigricans]|uniref:C2H2-type domain-containing protein n=1 Tax=Ascodesmis nigricans TaxID=341454 RepID=A0A4S2MU65_9PEZI|nr:hypothetical protein EX30DRAFT_60856 [Ascodesmis nigricans]
MGVMASTISTFNFRTWIRLIRCIHPIHYLALPNTPRHHFLSPDLSQDPANLFEEIISFGPSTPTGRTPIMESRPDGMGIDSAFLEMSARARAHTFPLAEHQHISTFDLAPLPEYNFINMSTLTMPSDDDVESYHTAPSIVTSPAFHSSPALLPSKEPVYQQPLPTIPEAKPEIAAPKAAPKSQQKPKPQPKPEPFIKKEPVSEAGLIHIAPKGGFIPPPINTADAKTKPRKKGRLVEPIPASAITETGISFEEISAYISQPSPVDGKWVCLYPECSKRFGRKENIKSHVQTHLNDRQYQCSVCKKCFVRQHDLKRHAKIHTGVKPYPCLCGNSFARHDALTRHRQRGMCVGAFEGVVKKVGKRGRPKKRSANDDGDDDQSEVSQEPTRRPKRIKRDQSDRHTSIASTATSTSSSGSDSGDNEDIAPEIPRAKHEEEIDDFPTPTPGPDTPTQTTYDSATSSSVDVSTQSVDDNNTPFPFEEPSPNYTPPTSPPELYDFDDIVDKNISNLSLPLPLVHGSSGSTASVASSSFTTSSSTTTTTTTNDVHDLDYSDLGLDIPGFSHHHQHGKKYGSEQHGDEEYIFGGEMFQGLTTLERDPGILGLAEEEGGLVGFGGLGGFIKPELLTGSG